MRGGEEEVKSGLKTKKGGKVSKWGAYSNNNANHEESEHGPEPPNIAR